MLQKLLIFFYLTFLERNGLEVPTITLDLLLSPVKALVLYDIGAYKVSYQPYNTASVAKLARYRAFDNHVDLLRVRKSLQIHFFLLFLLFTIVCSNRRIKGVSQ